MAKRLARTKKSTKANQPIEVPEGQSALSESPSIPISRQLIGDVVEALWLPSALSKEEKLERVRSAMGMLEGMRLSDQMEQLLGAQMIGVHSAAMECLRRAMIPEQTFEGREANLKQATKLLALYEKQLAALDKRRGKGQQKVTVEHVQVQAGGQAIVGTVEHKGKG